MAQGQITLALVGLAMLSALAARAAEDCQKQIKLNQASGGVFMDAKGKVDISSHGNRQQFKVTLNSPVYDGVAFLVYANGQRAGTIVMRGGSGRLEINNEGKTALPTALDPVCKIRTVQVTTPDGGLVLQGRF